MNSNREERLQMRQRGAASRKTKEVDFGFSLGLGPPAGGPSQQPPPPQPPPATHAQPPASSPKIDQAGSQNQEPTQRTPRSARNALPERPSMFDIPPDDDEDSSPLRSIKRRRIETPGRISRKPAARPESRPPEPPKDHATNVTEKPELPVAGSTGQDKQPPNEVPVPVPIPATGVPETQQDGKSEANGADREAQATSAPPPEAALKAPEARSVQDQEATQPEPPQTLPEIAEGSQVPRSPQRLISRRQGDAQDQPEKVTTPEAPVESTQGPISPPKPGAQGSIRGAPQESQAPQRTSHPDAEGKRKRRDSSKDQPSPEHTTPEAAAVDKSAEPSQPPQPPQEPDTQDQADEQQQRPQREKRLSPRQGAKGKRKRQQVAEEQPPKDTTVPETTSAKQPQEKPDNQDHVEETSSKPREKRQRGRRPSSAQTSDKGKEPENRVIPDNALPIDSAKNRELPAATEKPSQVQGRSKDDATETRPRPQSPKAAGRKRAKRPAKKTARSEPREQEEEEAASGDEQAEPSTSTAAPEQPAEQEENSQPTRKRQSRGDTVPVTVHRLANLASLHGIPDSDSETDGSSGSADELSTRQKTKHPSRGGVNQADVLNQICRETLEKTLTTLKNGIANESNATRKAEWTRKKKAVEAYGTELEGRLFEMSEMLDSNFVLGVKLRRAKREMMEMRSRLYHVRRERETIAVRTDDVRKRFVEEERARISRTNINNTLHSLELAVDRDRNTQHRPTHEQDSSSSQDSPTGTATAGLEYLVRAVAEEVSSRGNGAGLLDQIKAFNAELEMVAHKVES